MVSHPDGQPKGFGFVEYVSTDDARAAIKVGLILYCELTKKSHLQSNYFFKVPVQSRAQ